MNFHQSLVITPEGTPNPNTLKFEINRVLCETGSANFPDAASAARSELAKAVFAVANVESVLIGKNFISVTKLGCADWQAIKQPVVEAIRHILAVGKSAVDSTSATCGDSTSAAESDADREIIGRIKEILDNEIRPALAMDGGDVTFVGYAQGIVKLRLQGSCRHCPSATMTLKLGVESRLRSLIPAIQEVVAV
ncbi:MAG: NifU family protein [Candidatus Omnitrophota bacterium]